MKTSEIYVCNETELPNLAKIAEQNRLAELEIKTEQEKVECKRHKTTRNIAIIGLVLSGILVVKELTEFIYALS